MTTEEKKTSIKVLPFYGDEEGKKGYSPFEFFLKAEVFAKKNGFFGLMDGTVAVPVQKTDTNGDPIEFSDAEKKVLKLEAEAMEFLLMTCHEDAFAIVHPHKESNLQWKALKDRYEPETVEDLVAKMTDFENCRLEIKWSDPFKWMLEMERLDKEIQMMGGTAKTRHEMQATIIARLPKELYKPVITNLYSKISDTAFTRGEFVKEITNYYKTFIHPKVKEYEKKKGGTKNSAFTADGGGKPWQQFKGKCHNCGKQGHKSTNCPDKKQGGGNAGYSGGFKGKCYKCGKTGHVKAKCPNNEGGNYENALGGACLSAQSLALKAL